MSPNNMNKVILVNDNGQLFEELAYAALRVELRYIASIGAGAIYSGEGHVPRLRVGGGQGVEQDWS